MVFGLFKNKKKELAQQIYGAFRPKIDVSKKIGKWKDYLSYGDAFINDDYLLGFFNMYASIVSRKFGFAGKESGEIIKNIYEMMDPSYSEIIKLQRLFDRYHLLSTSKPKDFILGSDHAAMFFLVFVNDQAAHNFSKDPIYKEAQKYFSSGGFEKENEWAKKMMPKDLYDAEKMSEAPSNIVVAHRIFDKTFNKRLMKTFKFKMWIFLNI